MLFLKWVTTVPTDCSPQPLQLLSVIWGILLSTSVCYTLIIFFSACCDMKRVGKIFFYALRVRSKLHSCSNIMIIIASVVTGTHGDLLQPSNVLCVVLDKSLRKILPYSTCVCLCVMYVYMEGHTRETHYLHYKMKVL